MHRTSGHVVSRELLEASDKKFGDMGTVVCVRPNNGVGALQDCSANGKWSPSEKLTLGFGCLGLRRTDLGGQGGTTGVSFGGTGGPPTSCGTGTGCGAVRSLGIST